MNNSFEQCIADICGLELSSLIAGGKYCVFGGSVAVVECHKGIAEYSSQKVSFCFGKGFLDVNGSELKIRCLEKHYAVITGKILGVAVRNE